MRPKKPVSHQHLQLEQPRQPQLVLHHAVLDARLLRRPVQIERFRGGGRDRLLAIDVLARGDRALEEPAAGAASRRRRRTPCRPCSPAPGPCRWSSARRRAPAPDAARASALRPTRIGSGISRVPSFRATPPWRRISRIERTRCWFVPMRPVTPCMMMPMRFVVMRPWSRGSPPLPAREGACIAGGLAGRICNWLVNRAETLLQIELIEKARAEQAAAIATAALL